MLFSESVEALKLQYTDKYVAVDAACPELARFRGAVGQVKTVNMNGRALVEFIDYHLNTGWFDIDLSCLKIVDKPAPKVVAEKKAETKKPAAAPATKAPPAAGAKKLSPLEMARAQGAGGAAPAASGLAPPPTAEKKSVSDVLAAARGKAAAPGTPAPPAPPAPPAASDLAPEPPAAPPAPLEPTPPAPPAAASGAVKVDRKSMSVADMLAAARKSDAK